MKRFENYYHTTTGRVVIATVSGMAAGYIIYLLRGVAIAPFICGAASGGVALIRPLLKNRKR